ncbi:MAG: hypothetical protein MMC23_005930 [Stictis urceolatum]|nr:hypothetical protein [Stictis urceolata]
MGVMSAPAPEAAAISKRQDFDAVALVTNLQTTLQPNIDSIQSTATSITADSTDEEKAAASSSIAGDISTMVAAVEAADAQIPTTASKRNAIEKRQAADIATEIGAILSPLSTASDAVIAALGLSTTLDLFNPLSVSLSKLLRDLEVVVDDLLAIVKQLLDGLLSGLSAGLAGITF